MNLSRLLLLLAVGCLLHLLPATAQTVSPPFAMDKQYSADVMIMMKDGTTLRGMTYIDGDKMRSEMTTSGVDSTTIIRKDEKKMYILVPSSKMAMEMPYDPDKVQKQPGANFGPEGKFELIGPDKSDSIACNKYKVTSEKNGQVFFFWLDEAKKVPVRMEADDKSIVVKWRYYKVGPQEPSLFLVPTGYQTMQMPSMPGAQ